VTTTREKHAAVVVAVGPPLEPGTFEVKCNSLTGDPDLKLPVPIAPTFMWGWFLVPDVGETIEIEVVTQDDQSEVPNQAFLDDLDIRWTGRRFVAEESEAPREYNSDFTSKNYGKRRGFATPAGHVLMFDDTEGEEQIQITWTQPTRDPAGKAKISFITIDKNGSIILANKRGKNMLFMDADKAAISIFDEHSNVVSLNDKGVKIVGQGGWIELKDGVVNMTVNGVINLQGNGVNVGNGADEPAVLGNALVQWLLQQFSCMTAFGPSGPLVPTATPLPAPAGPLSVSVKIAKGTP